MKLSSYEINGTLVFTPREAIVQGECDELRAFIADKALSGSSAHAVIDLGEVPFIDSAGLELLCDLKSACAKGGGQFMLACVTDICQEIFRLTDLSSRFDVFDSVEEGVKSLE
jgi:anti-anti-sigma factor